MFIIIKVSYYFPFLSSMYIQTLLSHGNPEAIPDTSGKTAS